jgi:hypothetical protein
MILPFKPKHASSASPTPEPQEDKPEQGKPPDAALKPRDTPSGQPSGQHGPVGLNASSEAGLTPGQLVVARADRIGKILNEIWPLDQGYTPSALLLLAAWNLKRHSVSRADFIQLAATQWDAVIIKSPVPSPSVPTVH